MEKLLIKLIEEHDSIIIPDFGTLLKSGDKIIFNGFLKFNDGKLQKALAEDKGISPDEAKKEIEQFANRLASQAESGETATIEGLGSFYKDSIGSIVFSAFASEQNQPLETKKTPIEPEPFPTDTVTTETIEPVEEPEEELSPAENELDELLDTANDTAEKPLPVSEPIEEIETSKDQDIASLEEEIKEAIKKDQTEEKAKKAEKKEKKEKSKAKKEKAKEIKDKPAEEIPAITPEPEKKEEVAKEEIKEAPFFDKNDRLEEKILDQKEEETPALEDSIQEEELTTTTVAMTHVAPEVEEHHLPPVQVKEKKKKKKSLLWLILLLILIGGGVFAGLKWDMVSGWIGLKSDKKEQKKENPEGENQTNETNTNVADNENEVNNLEPEEIVTDSTEFTEPLDENIESNEAVTETSTETPEENTPTVEEPVNVVQNSGSNSGSHHVIAGAFSSKQNADALVNTLQSKGFSSARLLGRFNGEYYQVAAGSYNSATEANSQLTSVNAVIGGGAWVLVKDL